MEASILTIGDELLLGDTVDNNSTWIVQQLNSIGIECLEIRTVKDSVDAITSSISDLLKKSDILFITGGLGPTNDDKTKEAICKYFDDKLVQNKEAFENMKQLFSKIKKDHLVSFNKEQSFLPSKCNVIKNKTLINLKE